MHLVGATEDTDVDVLAGNVTQDNTGEDGLNFISITESSATRGLLELTVGIARPQAILLIRGFSERIAGD